jgi:hypothetical protein
MRLSAANSGGGLPSPKNRNAREPGPACTPGRTEGHDSLQATRECVKAVTDAHRWWSWRVRLLSRLAGSKSLVPHNAQNSTESHLDYAVHNRMICTSLSSRRTSKSNTQNRRFGSMVVLSVFVRAVPLRGHAALRALADRRRLNGESGSWAITGRRAPGAAVACPSRSCSPRFRMTAARLAKRGKPGGEEGSAGVGSPP